MTETINTYQSTKAAPRWLELTALSISPYVSSMWLHVLLRENLCTAYSGRFSRAQHSFHTCCSLNGIKVWVFSGKKNRKRHLCRHDKNCYYFFKSNIRIINLIVGSSCMMEVSRNMSL